MFGNSGRGASWGLFGTLIQTSAGNSGLANNQLCIAVAERLVGEPEGSTRSEIKKHSPRDAGFVSQMSFWS
jgi:hypothetical protein